ncbi:hypothetical protein [Kordiimonas pumila]|uniref:BioF2-like acetyltransferase domain-containing protein n=1 Tax=Kordiimonas pumila TaxID=2161677 RepID=A0ABV7D506_9PROT|nr:hypothetical protein [Kordiimonas pumila]
MKMVNSHITFKIGVLNPVEWTDISSESPFPLQQHPCYGLALKKYGANPLQLNIYENEALIGRALVMQRRFLRMIDFSSIFRGPAWCDHTLAPEKKLAVLKALKSQFNPFRWNFLSVMPEEPASDSFKSSMRSIGYRQVVTGFSTVWMDIRPPVATLRKALKGKWRNQLKTAEKNTIDISIGGKKPHQYSWLLEKEALQRRERQYQGVPVGLVTAYSEAGTAKNRAGILSVTALSDRNKIAGAVFLLHGNSATYHIGWVGEEGRQKNAQNRVLWEGICALKEANISFLDLGGLNTADLAGIARFKLGLGTAPTSLAGTYI